MTFPVPPASEPAPRVLPERAYPADDVTLTTPRVPEPYYPHKGHHTWGAFAVLAIEAGGYGDLIAVNPYNGHELCAPVATVSGYGTGDPGTSAYDQLRALIDEMERQSFLEGK